MKYKWDIICFILITLTLPIFFYKLGQSSLSSWDEAWYADISRTISQTGDLVNLTWNGSPYLDHPPFGFWVTALTFKIFGINEFWARFPQAISAVLSLFLVYLLGKELFNRLVGGVSALALSSAFWFVNRARSGNLDILLTLMFLLNFYLAFKAVKKQKYLLSLSLSLAALFLTKTMVPFLILPSLAVILWPIKNKAGKNLFISFGVFSVWFTYQTLTYPEFIHSYLDVGLRGVKVQTNFLSNLILTKTYLYNGIGRWFWPGILGLSLIIFLRQKRVLPLVIFVVLFLLPFIFSAKVQIWHLIPLYPFLILSFFGGCWVLLSHNTEQLAARSQYSVTRTFVQRYLAALLRGSSYGQYLYPKRYILFVATVILSSYFYFNQIRQIWYQMIDIPRYISDEAILSKEASKYSQRLLIDGDFNPAAAFYAQKTVSKIHRDELIGLFKSSAPFLLITNDWRINEVQIDPQSYKLIKKDRDKVLVLH